jgi:hypothetical protein
MPKLFVVSDEADAEGLATAILGTRIGAVRRAAAIDAIRRANPGVDFERLPPGVILTVPDGPDLADKATDPVAALLDDLVARASAALDAVPAALDEAEQARRAEGEATRAVLGSAAVAQVSQLSPQLQNNVQSVAKDLEAQDAAAQTDREALLEGVKQWDAVLAELRTLGGG